MDHLFVQKHVDDGRQTDVTSSLSSSVVFQDDLDLNLYSLGLLLILLSLDISGDRSLNRTYLIRYEDILFGVAHHGNFTWKYHLPPRPTEL